MYIKMRDLLYIDCAFVAMEFNSRAGESLILEKHGV